MATAHDAAAVILESGEGIDALKLQKLLYYAQAWSLAVTGEPLFSDQLRGWKNGPVVPGVWQTYRDHEDRTIPEPRGGSRARLTEQQVQLLESALSIFGDLTGTELTEVVHHDAAWQDAWRRRKQPEQGNEPIDAGLMATSARSILAKRGLPQEIRQKLDRAVTAVYDGGAQAGDFAESTSLAKTSRKALAAAESHA